jgi:hypothetical protein
MKYIQYTFFLVLMSSCLDNGNSPPVVEKIILDPSGNFTPGSDIQLSAIVTDAEGDPLEYYWESAGGIIEDPTAEETGWELYEDAEPLSYESVTLTVSDGKSSDTHTRTIQVSDGLLVEGRTYFSGTKIPVAGVSVNMGKFFAISDHTGYYIIRNLKEGLTMVSANRDGFDPFESEVYVDNPKSVYNIFMTSPTETHQINGRVETIDGISFENLKVVLLNPDGSESQLSAMTAEDGSYSIPAVPGGIRQIMIKDESENNRFLNDSIVYQVMLDQYNLEHHPRIKIRRTILADDYLSGKEMWDNRGSLDDGFYVIGKGEQLSLREFIEVPPDAEEAMLYLESFVVGGCDMVGRLPSHRIWISNEEGRYLGGLSWGGEGNNYPATLSWFPSSSPTFMNIYDRSIRIHLEISDDADCIPNPRWRIFRVHFSYYY